MGRMFKEIIAGKALPRNRSAGHGPLFRSHRWLPNLRVLEIEEIKSIPYVPVSHPFVERLIGTIRREVLNQIFFLERLRSHAEARNVPLLLQRAARSSLPRRDDTGPTGRRIRSRPC